MQKVKELFLFVVLLSIPFLIALCLWFGNMLSLKYNVSLTPIGIGNTEWFLFWGAYLAGLCTLIAVYLTLQQNRKSIKTSLNENRKAINYQFEIQSINEELTIISEAISSLQFNYLNTVIRRHQDTIFINSALEKNEILSILKNIQEKMFDVENLNTKIQLETELFNDNCQKCLHYEMCSLGQNKIALREKYWDTCRNFLSALSAAYNYILTAAKNLEYKIQISKYEVEIEQHEQKLADEPPPSDALQEALRKAIAGLHRSIAQHSEQIDDELQSKSIQDTLDMVKDFFRDETLQTLIALAKEYKKLRMQRAQLIQNGKQVPHYEEATPVPEE